MRTIRVTVSVVIAVLILAAACTNSEGASPTQTVEPVDTTAGEDTTSTTETIDDTGPDSTASGLTSTLDWASCDAFECATLEVPLDHGNPEGDQIEISVIRRPASDTANRIGSVVLNPGGPGGSGIEYLPVAALGMPQAITDRFDLVSFDPRGVGESSAVDCDLSYDDAVVLVGESDDAGWAEALTSTETDLEQCSADAVALAPWIGTNNAARDLDQLRAALGDEKLTYIGYSYGTRLGATYAELFPDNVRALVLDSAVLPNDELALLEREQARGFDRAFENFAAACDADEDCLLREIGPTLDVFRSIESEILDVGSFATDSPDRVLTAGEFYVGVIASLYSAEAWPFLAQALYTAETVADGTLLQVLADTLVDRKPDGTYGNSNEANRFINCADDSRRASVDETRLESEATADMTSYFGDAFRGGTGCLFTPDPIDPLVIGPATGSPPILVLGNTGDPATPYEWSQILAESLESAVLYTIEAEGHTAYPDFDCVLDVVNAYLIDVEVPAEGSSCSENATADFFPTAGESDVDQILAFIDCLNAEGLDIGEVTVADLLADSTGEELLSRIDLEDPATLTAIFACQDLLPAT